MHELDEDTRVRALGPGAWSGRLSDRWGIGMVPNGGYVLAVATSAIREALPGLDPLTVTAHYLRPARPGDARVEVEVVKSGRRFSTVSARLLQETGEVIRVLGTWGRLPRGGEPLHAAGEPPSLPPLDSLAPAWAGDPRGVRGAIAAGPPMTIRDRFDVRFDPATDGFLRGERGERAEIRAWLRFADRRVPDVHCLGLVADALPSPAFHLVAPGWLPTIELTVHVRAHPVGEWLRCSFRTRFVQGGLLEEDGEIWDESGALVALSRQLAALPPDNDRSDPPDAAAVA